MIESIESGGYTTTQRKQRGVDFLVRMMIRSPFCTCLQIIINPMLNTGTGTILYIKFQQSFNLLPTLRGGGLFSMKLSSCFMIAC